MRYDDNSEFEDATTCRLEASYNVSDAIRLRAATVDTGINRVWRDFHTATQHALLVP